METSKESTEKMTTFRVGDVCHLGKEVGGGMMLGVCLKGINVWVFLWGIMFGEGVMRGWVIIGGCA